MIPTAFSLDYNAETPTRSMEKLARVACEAHKGGLADIHAPTLDVRERLLTLHHPEYVRAFLSGNGFLAKSQGWPWTSAIRDGVLAINSGQLLAARLAFDHGLSANIAQGFHHALYDRGGGYCTFNGLALIAQEYPNKRICVLDADEHQGNGTLAFTRRLENLWNLTIYGTWMDGDTKDANRHWEKALPSITNQWDLYVDALHTAFLHIIEQARPDLIIYQAGADPHIDDPLGTLGMTSTQMRERDRKVFEFAKESGIPLMFVLAGGYQAMKNLVPLHLATFEEANSVYFAHRRAAPFA